MDQPTYGRVSTTITKLSIAEEFCGRFRGKVFVGDNDSFTLNGIVTNGKFPRVVAPSVSVGEDFVLNLVRALIAELAAKTDEATVIRVGSYSFAMGCLAFIRRDSRLEPAPMRKHADESHIWFFNDLAALARGDAEHF